MRPTAFRWIGTGLFAALLVAGCSHSQKQAPTMSARPMQTTHVYQNYPQAAPVVTQLPDAQATATPEKTTPAELPAPKAEPEMQAASYKPETKDEVKRRSFTDVTAKPGMEHAENYGWLKGELQCLHGPNGSMTWNLRYASVDEEDKFGGSVTLVDMGRGHNFQSGQMVKVEGEVLDPETKPIGGQSFKYRVRNIEAVNP
jgi:hypothetical protein